MSTTDVWMYVIVFVLYFALNIVGTIYYTKLKNKDHKSVGLLSVLLGWCFMPFINLYSPIMYESE